MTSLRALSVAIAATALLLVGASTATAAVTVGVTSDQGLRIAVSGGNATEVGVRPNSDGTKLEVTEQSAQMVLGSGCVQTDSTNPQRFRCNRPPLNFVTFAGGTARDKLFVAPGSGDCLCFGGAGNDELTSAEGADLVEGGSGADLIDAGAGGDVVRGGDGDDTLTGGPGTDREDGDAGNDVLRMGGLPDGNRDDLFGGAGRDEVDYGSRRAKVNVTLGETFDDGAPTIGFLTSEADNAHEDIEVITGGGGPDELAARFTVGATVSGGAGDDRLQGGSESDTLRGDTGSDAMFAGFGADTLFARDAIDDQVNQAIQCGSGSDVLDADVRDDDTRPLPTDCEQISQGMVGETRNVVIRYARRSRRGRLKIGLRCPRRTRNGCRGRLRVGVLRRTRGRLRVRFGRSAPYRIRRGRSRVVVARVRGRRTPRRGTRVRVYSRERGRLGPRTTFRTLRVRR